MQLRQHSLSMVFGVMLACVLAAAGFVGLNVSASQAFADDSSSSSDSSLQTYGSIRYTAIIGSDQWQPSGYSFHLEGSDLQILMATDTASGKVWLVSVPRDTFYDTGRGKYKSNYVYQYAFNDAKAEGYSNKECQKIAARKTADMMGELFGIYVDNYIVTNINDYGDLINRIGGVNVYVPYTVDYSFYALTNLTTGAVESPFSPITIYEGDQTLDGFAALSLARARTGYDAYGYAQDPTRQDVNRLTMVSLINRVLTDERAIDFVTPLINLGLIDTDYNAEEVVDLIKAFTQHNSVTIYSASGPVNGDIMDMGNDQPWLIPYDQLWYQNIIHTIQDGWYDGDTAWLNDYYNSNTGWFPISWSRVVYPNGSQQKSGTFSDVYQLAWYYDCVEQAASLGYIHGYDNGAFGPNDNLTRGQAACMFANMAGKDGSVSYSGQFPDVTSDKYYADNVAWAKTNGVMNGYENGDRNGYFGPDDTITREQVACTLYNYAKSIAGTDVTVDDVDGALAAFPDGGNVSDWAREAVAWCVTNHIMGNGGYINPGNNISRAEMAAMMTNFQS